MTNSAWQIENHDVPFSSRGRTRRITVAMPCPDNINNKSIVYCADGQVIETLAFALRSLPEDNLPILVGVHSDPEVRAQEYLPSTKDLYLAHESFFVENVRSWAHDRFDITMARDKSFVFGFSNGGAFAISVAFRHCDRFAAAIAFSIPPFGDLPVSSSPCERLPEIYLASGNQGPEKSIRKNMVKLRRSLQRRGASLHYCERTCGHTLDFWTSEFAEAIQWLNRGRPQGSTSHGTTQDGAER